VKQLIEDNSAVKTLFTFMLSPDHVLSVHIFMQYTPNKSDTKICLTGQQWTRSSSFEKSD